MSQLGKTMEIASSPHVASGASVDTIMRNVVYAMLPVVIFAVYAFGLSVLLLLVTAVLACMGTEYVLNRLSGKSNTLGDWSAITTGLLYGLTLPPDLALWMVVVGAVFGVGITKSLFGGLGSNAFNPALVGRAFLQAAFPGAMTTWSPAFAADRFTQIASSTLAFPFASPEYDAVSAATPLSSLKFRGVDTDSMDLALGLVSGSAGETCAVLILLGGIYLVARNMMNWRITASILATVVGMTVLMNMVSPGNYPEPAFMLFSGGLMLGALFMATDMVTSPLTKKGRIIFGLGCGFLTFVIRRFGNLPEGVSLAIIFMNILVPLIDRFVKSIRLTWSLANSTSILSAIILTAKSSFIIPTVIFP